MYEASSCIKLATGHYILPLTATTYTAFNQVLLWLLLSLFLFLCLYDLQSQLLHPFNYLEENKSTHYVSVFCVISPSVCHSKICMCIQSTPLWRWYLEVKVPCYVSCSLCINDILWTFEDTTYTSVCVWVVWFILLSWAHFRLKTS